jgi:hypothetical protein
MWSGFMELDQKKLAATQADGQLEKPFDAEALRAVVQKLVPSLKDNPISKHVVFPLVSEPAATAPLANPEKKEEPTWTMSSFEEMPTVEETLSVASNHEELDEQWVRKDLNKFQVNVPETDEVDVAVDEVELASPKMQRPVIDPKVAAALPKLSDAEIEAIIRSECRAVIERLVWKLVPEMASKLIREEIQRLTDEPRL